MTFNNCQHCGQGAISCDANGPVCPDCIEEGYSEHEDTNTRSGDLIPRDELTPKIKAAILDAQLRAFEQGRIDTPSEIEAKALTAIKESKDEH